MTVGRPTRTSSALPRLRLFIGAVATLALTGCRRDLQSAESALAPAGPQAQHISHLMWLYMGVCAVVYLLVFVVLIGAFLHRRRGKSMEPTADPITEPDPHHERRMWTVVSGAIVVTVVTLFVLLFGDFAVGRSLHTLSDKTDPANALRIAVTGHQWWWDVKYMDWPERFGERIPVNLITTANEIHVPVDPQHPVAVECELDSGDVIHSFWVPSLNGKKDLVPGHATALWFRADHPGVYWGDCAEYCGYQHAQMRIAVVAEPVADFQKWLASQRQMPPDPQTPVQMRGRDVFMHGTCATCHTVTGTEARGRVGPDLTHVASRQALAAGAVANVPGHLAGWVIDPQRIKPGARMPQNNLAPDDLRALLEYLETLK